MSSRASIVLAGLLALACTKTPGDGESDSTSSDNGDEATETSPGTDSGTDTMAALGCQEIGDKASCEAASIDGVGCVWLTIQRASRSGDVCTLEPVEMCFSQELYDTAAGCAPAAGCEDTFYTDPFFRVDADDTVLLIDMCGGTPPDGFAPCPSGEASVDNPPECACACALAP